MCIDDELPGMWSSSDFTGGQTDCEESKNKTVMVDEAKLLDILQTVNNCYSAIENLLPGAANIVADVGLINDAMTGAVKSRNELEAILTESIHMNRM